jgi:ribosomal-protein-alanine N-acetyltransferase
LREQEDLVIGSCGFFNLTEAGHMAELGYDLHPDCLFKGFMSKAVRAMIEIAFSDARFHLNWIEALTYLEHSASVNLLLRLGFQEEGVQWEYGWWKGQAHDLRNFSLLRRAWRVENAIK